MINHKFGIKICTDGGGVGEWLKVLRLKSGGLYRHLYLHAKNLRIALRFQRKNWYYIKRKFIGVTLKIMPIYARLTLHFSLTNKYF